MPRVFATALAAGLALLSAIVLPATAGPFYTLTGTVGDANWIAADPAIAGPGSFELLANLSSVFQANGGPGGMVTFDFSGPAILGARDKETFSYFDITATCRNPAGCDPSGYSYSVQQVDNQVPCCLTYPIDANFYVQELELPPFAPDGAMFEGYRKGFTGLLFDVFESAGAAGQPFSLTVNTDAVSAVPEPPAWPLMLAGPFAIGLIRRRRRNIAMAAGGAVFLSVTAALAGPTTYVFEKTTSTVPGYDPVATVTIDGTFADLPTLSNTANPGPYDFGSLLALHFEAPDPGFGSFGLGDFTAQTLPYDVPMWSISPAGIQFTTLVSGFHFYFPPSGLVVASDFDGRICPRSCIADGAWVAETVPEPSALWVMLACLAAGAGIQRKRRPR